MVIGYVDVVGAHGCDIGEDISFLIFNNLDLEEFWNIEKHSKNGDWDQVCE